MGPEEEIAFVREMTRERTAPSRFEVKGLVAGPPGSSLVVSVSTELGGRLASKNIHLRAPDGKADFLISDQILGLAGRYSESSVLTVEQQERGLLRLLLGGTVRSAAGSGFALTVESSGPIDGPGGTDIAKVRVLDFVHDVYRFSVPPLLVVLVVGMLIMRSRRPLLGRVDVIWLVVALLAGMLARIFVLSLIHVTAFPVIVDARYFSPLHPLLLVTIWLSMAAYSTAVRSPPGHGSDTGEIP